MVSDVSASSDASPIRLPTPLRWVLGLFGLSAVAVGAVAVFEGHDGAATATMITIGMALVALALLSPYFRRFKAGGVEVELLQEQVAKTQSALRALVTDIAVPMGEAYELIRLGVDPGPERTRLLDGYNALLESTFADVAEQGRYADLSVDDVRTLFHTHGDGGRIGALALMSRAPELAVLECLEDAIAHSHSAFEQYRALLAAASAAPALPQDDQRRLLQAVETGRHWYTSPDDGSGPDSSRVIAERQLRAATSPQIAAQFTFPNPE